MHCANEAWNALSQQFNGQIKFKVQRGTESSRGRLVSMRASSSLLIHASIVLVSVLARANSADVDADTTILRWASAGGGWRSMAASMGIANIFAQAGLFGDESSSSQFTALSMQSGTAWFATQFFYSQPFYNATLLKNSRSSWLIGWISTDSIQPPCLKDQPWK
jgi:hypothetical protein